MTNEQFLKWIDYVCENGINPPKALFKRGFDNWQTRIMVARFLSSFRLKKIEPAIELYYSVLDVEVTEAEDIEQKAWALRDLGACIWSLEKDANKALKYLDMSIQLAESIKYDYSYIARGELWYDRWHLLKILNRTTEAINEADEKIAAQNLESKNNSYLYYAYRFKSEIVKEQDIDQALELLYKAVKYFPEGYDEENSLEKLWINRDNDKQATYEEIEKLTDVCDLSWDI